MVGGGGSRQKWKWMSTAYCARGHSSERGKDKRCSFKAPFRRTCGSSRKTPICACERLFLKDKTSVQNWFLKDWFFKITWNVVWGAKNKRKKWNFEKNAVDSLIAFFIETTSLAGIVLRRVNYWKVFLLNYLYLSWREIVMRNVFVLPALWKLNSVSIF